MSKAPTECAYCDHTDPNCGFCEMGVPLDTQDDWDRSWGRITGGGWSNLDALEGDINMIEDDELMDAARAFSQANVEVSLARTARERRYASYMEACGIEDDARNARNKALTALLAVGAHSVSE